MVNLDELKAEILAIGETIKTLKSTTPVDKDAVTAAVASLLAAKQLYADNNNGIGVDGQPFVKDPPSKKDKKKNSTSTAGTEPTMSGDAKQVR
jgi:1,6-anhydro-N-acetylmuramate kinase